ncbi:23S rRNA (uracil(1939)-C(5))-methyltransferase RlmD [Pseudomonadota bacterium]
MARRRRRKSKPMPTEAFSASIESLEHDGRGVAHVEGKVVFIEGALPGEEVKFRYLSQRKSYDEGVVAEVLTPSSDRVPPKCEHFGICGGCSLQHMEASAQIKAKQQIMEEHFRHIGKVEPETIMPALTASHWGYRRKARLGSKYVVKKESQFVGFREKRSSFLADLDRCEVLHPSIGTRITGLRSLIGGLDAFDRLPQVEVAVADEVVALVFRHLDPLSTGDIDKLVSFGESNNIHIYLQPKGPDTVSLLWPSESTLSYKLDEFGVELRFKPTDFTQVNIDINRKMVSRAIELLDLKPEDRVLDLFCGLGNFTLPLSRRCGHVVGVEGDELLVERGRENAQLNAVDNIEFFGADLTKEPYEQPWFGKGFDKILIDPPRSGAFDIVKYLDAFGASKIVYVSCNPATLARDAAVLVEKGYKLKSAGVMDMFPHTTHVESIALFKR